MPTIHKIYGAPGTGKTTRLIEIVKNHLNDGIEIERIAYLAFTNAAADEAFDRVKPLLTRSKRPPFFSTIHAAARRSTAIPRPSIWGAREWKELEEMTGMRFPSSDFVVDDDARVNGRPIVQCIQFAAARGIDPAQAIKDFEVDGEVVTMTNVHRVLTAMCRIKDQKGKFDFDDILGVYLSRPEPLPVKIVLVDEAQDLSYTQWRCVENMWRDSDFVYICGDDDQSIYGFMGADPDGFLNYKADETEVLDQSWRCPQLVGKIAERIIDQVENRFPKDLKWRDEAGEVELTHGDRTSLPIDPSRSTMILVRHKVQALATYKQLLQIGIPCACGDINIFQEPIGKALYTYFRLRDGHPVALKDAQKMAELMINSHGMRKRLEDIRLSFRKNPKKRRDIVQSDCTFPFVDKPEAMFADTTEALRWAELITLCFDEHGYQCFDTQQNVQVSTMHASKGREADHVIILTDCYETVWQTQSGSGRDTERKVAYVAVTRARKKLTVLYPRTDTYVRALMESIR